MVTLDVQFANQIIEKVKEYMDYNVNIMNNRGIIIASLTKERIGTFHEIALRITQGDQDEILVENEDEYIGTQPGVNTAVYYRKTKIGVIGITGEPQKVRSIALILRLSIETMLEYEAYKEERFQRKNLKDQLLNLIMYGENVTEEKLNEYAKRLKLEERYVRIPVIFRFDQGAEFAESVIADIKEYHYLSKQDLVSVTRDNDVIVFKHFEEDLMKIFSDYKYMLGESVGAILRYLKSRDTAYTVYIGSFQDTYENYRGSYYHCKWLRDNYKLEGKSYFFYDYLNEYFRSFVPFREMRGIYEVFEKSMEEKEIESYISVISTLSAADFNLVEGSRMMYVHKNTLTYRLGKLKDAFGMNPVGESKDREFMTNLCDYLIKTVKKMKKEA